MSVLKPFVIGMLAGSLVACGKSSDDKKSKASDSVVGQQDIGFAQPAIGTKLTKEQVVEIKKTFSKKQMMVLPPGELVYTPKNMTAQEKQRKEEKLRREDANSYLLLKEIQGNCAKGRPTSTWQATFPTDGDVEIENLRQGDNLTASSSMNLAGGTFCPVDLNQIGQFSAKVDQVDAQAKTAQFSANMGVKGAGVMLKPQYAKLLQMRGLIVDSNLSGLAATRSTDGDGFLTFSLNGSYLGLDFDVPYLAEYKLKVEGAEKEMTCTTSVSQENGIQVTRRECKTLYKQMEILYRTRLQMPKFEADVIVHSTGANEKEIEANLEIYINGHKTSREEAEDLFGKGNPALHNSELARRLQ